MDANSFHPLHGELGSLSPPGGCEPGCDFLSTEWQEWPNHEGHTVSTLLGVQGSPCPGASVNSPRWALLPRLPSRGPSRKTLSKRRCRWIFPVPALKPHQMKLCVREQRGAIPVSCPCSRLTASAENSVWDEPLKQRQARAGLVSQSLGSNRAS